MPTTFIIKFNSGMTLEDLADLLPASNVAWIEILKETPPELLEKHKFDIKKSVRSRNLKHQAAHDKRCETNYYNWSSPVVIYLAQHIHEILSLKDIVKGSNNFISVQISENRLQLVVAHMVNTGELTRVSLGKYRVNFVND